MDKLVGNNIQMARGLFEDFNFYQAIIFSIFENQFDGFIYTNDKDKYDDGDWDADTTKKFGLVGNVYYDFAKQGFVTPFVGVGAGFSTASMERESSYSGVHSKTKIGDASRYLLNAQGGVSFGFTESLNLDVALTVGYTFTADDASTSDNTIIEADLGMKLRYTS